MEAVQRPDWWRDVENLLRFSMLFKSRCRPLKRPPAQHIFTSRVSTRRRSVAAHTIEMAMRERCLRAVSPRHGHHGHQLPRVMHVRARRAPLCIAFVHEVGESLGGWAARTRSPSQFCRPSSIASLAVPPVERSRTARSARIALHRPPLDSAVARFIICTGDAPARRPRVFHRLLNKIDRRHGPVPCVV